jgi:BirA family biotin operon repressor/biotin-[acetyl-CoA-carboxylase] ligase
VGIEQFLTNAKASVKVYDSLESTNTTAKELAISGAAHGTVVVAESQTDGKGRYGRGFESPKGSGIYMSIVLRPQDFGGKPVLVTSYAAVTVCEAIESLTDKSPTIKWVNDVFIDGKKICGILTEAVSDFESGGVQWVVVGIGINFTANENLPEVAGAVFEDSPCITRNRLIAEVVNRMLSFNGTCDISEYRKRLMWVGERVTATGHGEVVIVGVDDEARLIVRKDDLQEVALCSGEVSVVSLQSH